MDLEFKRGDVIKFKGSVIRCVIDAVLRDVDTEELILRIFVCNYTGGGIIHCNPHLVEKVESKNI